MTHIRLISGIQTFTYQVSYLSTYSLNCTSYHIKCIFAYPPLLSLAFCNLWSKCFFLELFFPSCFCQTTLIKMLFHLLFCLLAKGMAHFQLKQKMAFKPSPRCVCMFMLGDCSCKLFFPPQPCQITCELHRLTILFYSS